MTDIKTWKSEKLGITISIDYDKCLGNVCTCICPVQPKVYERGVDKPSAPNIDNCVLCCTCVYTCPKEAITHSSC